MKKKLLYFFIVTSLLLTTGCVTTSQDSVLFFVVEGGVQYFVTPTTFKSKKFPLQFDVTIREISGNVDSVVLNYTVPSQFRGKSLELSSGDFHVIAENPKVIYRSSDINRMSLNYDPISFKELIMKIKKEKQFAVTLVYKDGETLTFENNPEFVSKVLKLPNYYN